MHEAGPQAAGAGRRASARTARQWPRRCSPGRMPSGWPRAIGCVRPHAAARV